MTREEQVKRVLGVLRKRQAKSPREIAGELGYSAPQAVSRSLATLADDGRAVRTGSRDRPMYTKA